MAERSVTVELRPQTLRRPDGLIVAVRMYAPKMPDMWFWVNQEDGAIEDLREYRVFKLPEDSTG